MKEGVQNMAEGDLKVIQLTEKQTRQTEHNMLDLFDRVVNKKTTVFERFFPGAMGKVKDHHLEKILTQEFKSRAEQMRIISEHQRQGLTEFLNDELIGLKNHLREKQIRTLTERHAELTKRLIELELEFVATWEGYEAKISSLKNEKLKEKVLIKADEKVDMFLEMTASCLKYFFDIKEEIIKSNSGY